MEMDGCTAAPSKMSHLGFYMIGLAEMLGCQS